ncbi:hypothetical protein ACMG5I_02440 [Escherichia coli]|uniref:hypothetical protein n=1 Tax=Escherichia coli TaxID=562 RepID=UPI0039BFC77A
MSLIYFELPEYTNYPSRVICSIYSNAYHHLLLNSNKAVHYYRDKEPIILKNRYGFNSTDPEVKLCDLSGEVLVVMKCDTNLFHTYKLNQDFMETLSIRSHAPMIKVDLNYVDDKLKYDLINSLVYLE